MQISCLLVRATPLLQKSVRGNADCIIVVATDYQLTYGACVILGIERYGR